jgi:hypothetical protein
MSDNAYVYLLRDREGRIVYVGKGNRQRPYQVHNDDYEEARKLSSDVLITAKPFSTVKDAELAESLLIRVLAGNGAGLVNRAQMVQSGSLVPLVPQQEGVVRYEDFANAIFVKISPEKIDSERDVISGLTDSVAAGERCRQYWPIGSAVNRGDDIRYLVAVSTTAVKPVRVLGVWETAPVADWDISTGSITLAEAANGDVGSHRGKEMDWQGYNPQLVGYSTDVRSRW